MNPLYKELNRYSFYINITYPLFNGSHSYNLDLSPAVKIEDAVLFLLCLDIFIFIILII